MNTWKKSKLGYSYTSNLGHAFIEKQGPNSFEWNTTSKDGLNHAEGEATSLADAKRRALAFLDLCKQLEESA